MPSFFCLFIASGVYKEEYWVNCKNNGACSFWWKWITGKFSSYNDKYLMHVFNLGNTYGRQILKLQMVYSRFYYFFLSMCLSEKPPIYLEN